MSLDVYLTDTAGDDAQELYWRNITHNLGKMASEAGVYAALWRPDENGLERAAQLVEPLAAGLERLREQPTHFKMYNPENKWGSYDGLVAFIEDYLAACRRFPEALVRVSR